MADAREIHEALRSEGMTIEHERWNNCTAEYRLRFETALGVLDLLDSGDAEALESQISGLESEKEDLEDERDRLESELADRESEIEDLETTIESLKEQLAEYEAKEDEEKSS